MKEIIFMGTIGWQTEVAFRALQKNFNKIYILEFCPQIIKDLKRSEDEIISDVYEVECKYVFLGGYDKLISKNDLKKKTYFNLHPGLLPRNRGFAAMFYGIMNNDDYLGCSLHLVDENMDTGDIIHQIKVKYSGEKVKIVMNRINDIVLLELGGIVENYLDGKIIPTKQNHSIATWGCRRNQFDDCLINFNMDIYELKRYFAALSDPYPLPKIKINDIYYEVVEFNIIEREFYGSVGRCINKQDDEVYIKINGGILIIKSICNCTTKELLNPCNLIKIGYRFIKGD